MILSRAASKANGLNRGGIDTPPSPSASSTLIYHRVTVQPHKSNEKPWTRVHSDLQRGDAAYFKTLTHESVACSRDNTGKQRALSCPTSGKNDNEMTINLDFRLQEYQALKISRRYYIHIFPATLHTSRFFLIFQSFASSLQICNPIFIHSKYLSNEIFCFKVNVSIQANLRMKAPDNSGDNFFTNCFNNCF